jgi:hypothetical protein
MSNDHPCKKKEHSKKECNCKKNRCKEIRIINLWKRNRD